MKSLHDTSRRTVQVDKAYSGSSRVRDGSYETDSRQRGFYENATQYTATVTARRAQSVVEHRLVVDKEGFSEVAQRVEIPLGVGRKSGKTDREISKSVTRALMMRMIAYVACAPHARRKDTRTWVLTARGIHDISRPGVHALPEELVDAMSQRDIDGVSRMLDVFYKRLSQQARYAEEILEELPERTI